MSVLFVIHIRDCCLGRTDKGRGHEEVFCKYGLWRGCYFTDDYGRPYLFKGNFGGQTLFFDVFSRAISIFTTGSVDEFLTK